MTTDNYPRGMQFGPFRIERLLSNSGAMASVYEASIIDPDHPSRKGSRVALKIARTLGNSETYRDMLIKETTVLRKLRHPNIVRIVPTSDRGQLLWYGRSETPFDDNLPWYFAMELLSGDSLLGIFDSGKKYSLEWKLELIYQIGIAIDYLHIRNFSHRDLKPENILFRSKPQPNKYPKPVLIDLGLAEKRELRFNQDPNMKATVAYAPPEWIEKAQPETGRRHRPTSTVQSLNLDMAFDIWSFGVTAFEILSDGQHPFGDVNSDTAIIMNNILNRAPAPLPRDIPRSVQRVVANMLVADPAERPHIDQILEQLEFDIGFPSPRI